MLRTLLFFCCILLPGLVEAADSLKVRKKQLVAGFQAVAYRGSLQDSYLRWTPAYQFGLRFEKKKQINGMLSVSFGKFIGENILYKLPASADPSLLPVNRFTTRFFSLHYEAQLLLFSYHGFKLYASQGIGIYRFTVSDNNGTNLRDRDRTRAKGEDYRELTLCLPTQLGFRYTFSNRLAVGIQAGWTNVQSRYLDNMDQLSDNQTRDNMAQWRFQVYYPLK